MQTKKAFTLIELLVALAIVGILSGFIYVQVNGAINAANDAAKKANLNTIKKALVVYGVDNGNTFPVDSCVIGECDTLDTAIEGLLPSDIKEEYAYESTDGTSFTLSSVLSSGYSYTYDSSTSLFTTEQPANGACGSSDGQNLTSVPSSNLCSAGTAINISGTGPWTWTCPGVYGGSNASCSTGGVPLNGSCGSASGSSSYTAPTTDLCSAGTPSDVSGEGPWTWECAGSYAGLSPVCASNITIDGTCGLSNGHNLSSKPSTDLCSAGTPSDVSGEGPWTWTCTGTNGGATNSCSTGGIPVAGACGSNNGANLSSKPSTGLCSTGNATAVSGEGPWTWSCNGLNTGATVSCSTGAVPINGSCGSSNGTNLYSAPTTGLCSTGNATAVSGEGPWTWTCTGINNGTTSGTCTANKSVNGTCGSSNGANLSSQPSTNLCSTGTATTPSGSGPWSWSCTGQYSGTTATCATGGVPVAGTCGTKSGKYASTTPSGTEACNVGTLANMSGFYSWTCVGLNNGSSASCATVAATYTVVTFTSSTTWAVPTGVNSVEYLVVGGGGGGGAGNAGGGGGGGVLTGTVGVSGNVDVAVGAGGAAQTTLAIQGNNGSDSYFTLSIRAKGGGGGGGNIAVAAGLAGGSGGGGGVPDSGTIAGGFGTSGQGNAGGTGYRLGGGGGGGAGGAGENAGTDGTNYGGDGGSGIISSITGTATYYGGGGGGIGWVAVGAGGSGGGGTGALINSIPPTAGMANTGGGGGGGYGTAGIVGAAGGSGIVIIRYINNY